MFTISSFSCQSISDHAYSKAQIKKKRQLAKKKNEQLCIQNEGEKER